MYDRMILDASGVPVVPLCHVCERAKGIVICAGCRRVTPHVRRRVKCSAHPRAFFLMDIAVCNACRSDNLLEVGLDDIPDDLRALISPPEPSSARPTSTSSFDSGNVFPSPPLSPEMPSSSGALSPSGRRVSQVSSGQSPINENLNPAETRDIAVTMDVTPAVEQRNALVPGRGRGFKRQRVSVSQLQAAANEGNAQEVVAAPCDPVASPSTVPVPISVRSGGSCVCTRKVHFLVCANCGYYTQGVQKYIPCPDHPNEKQGIKFCPECGTGGDNLDETLF